MSDRVPLKTDVKEVSPEANLAVQVEKPVIETRSDSYMDDIDYHRMADWLDIGYEDRGDKQTAEKLSFLTDWARELTGSDDRMQVMTAIKDLKTRLGFQETGKTMVKKLYQWTRLDQNRKRIEKQMELV